MNLETLFPGAAGAYNLANTVNTLVLSVHGESRRFTANDESWNRVASGDRVKVWVQGDSHVVGVYVYPSEGAGAAPAPSVSF